MNWTVVVIAGNQLFNMSNAIATLNEVSVPALCLNCSFVGGRVAVEAIQQPIMVTKIEIGLAAVL